MLISGRGTSARAAVIPVIDPKSTDPGRPVGNAEKLETEIVEIGRLSVAPRVIRRKPGKFVLLLMNRSKDLNVVFELVRQDADTAPIFKLGGRSLWISAPQAAAAVNEAPGVLLLKAAATGTTLCTITIAEQGEGR